MQFCQEKINIIETARSTPAMHGRVKYGGWLDIDVYNTVHVLVDFITAVKSVCL